jgi:hypothetical protein
MPERIEHDEPLAGLPDTLRVPPPVVCERPSPEHLITGFCEVAGYPDARIGRGVGDVFVCQQLGRCVRTMIGVLPAER